MAAQNRNTYKKKSSGSRVAAITILIVIGAVVAGYFFRTTLKKPAAPPQKAQSTSIRPVPPAILPPQTSASLPLPAEQPLQPKHEVVPPVISAPSNDKTENVPGSMTGRLAIVIDDMGNSMAEARSLASIRVPLTFAIIPGLRVDREVAAYAATNKIETMIHIPMQSKGWPERRLEANGLLVSMSDDEIQERVAGFVEQFPGAVGVNNHMGSAFTGQEEKMSAVLQVLRKHNLFFIDSVTAPESTGWLTAQRAGVRTARRNVFLDNEQNRGYILGQLQLAVRFARKNGSAIAICHPHHATIAALAAALPGLERQGVQLVPASQLVK